MAGCKEQFLFSGGDTRLQKDGDDRLRHQATHHSRRSTVYSDGLKGFEVEASGCQARGPHRTSQERPAPERPPVVPLADRAIGNMQQWLIGWLGRGQAPYSVGSAYLLLPVSSGSASRAEP